MPHYTATTVSSLEQFFEDTAEIRERGFAISEQEFEEGINAMAAPISNPPIASVSIAGPAYRLTLERMLELGPRLLAAARDIGQEVEKAGNIK